MPQDGRRQAESLHMLISAHQLLKEESCFSLIELLIVMPIASILAAIAIPALGDQAAKAQDARTKETVHSTELAIETCRLESPVGSYQECDADALRALEPTLPPTPTLKLSNLGAASSTIIVQSTPTSQRFRVKRSAKGVLSLPCETKGVAGGPATGQWAD